MAVKRRWRNGEEEERERRTGYGRLKKGVRTMGDDMFIEFAVMIGGEDVDEGF